MAELKSWSDLCFADLQQGAIDFDLVKMDLSAEDEHKGNRIRLLTFQP
jgi:hypothetical protein